MNQQSVSKNLALPVYSLLVWMYAILAFWAANLGQANPYAIIRPGILTLLGGLLVLGLTRLWMSSAQRAAVLTAWWGILFTSYGHIYLQIENWSIGGLLLGRHRYLAVLWLMLAIAGILLIRRLPLRMGRFTQGANLVAAALVLMPLIQAGSYFIRQNPGASSIVGSSTTNTPTLTAPAELPDIYLIVLDAYGRQDLLERTYAYDNSEFINFLRGQGFYVADCSQSNYNHTWFSIASTLNMDYLENLGENGEKPRPAQIIKHSRVRELLSGLGYQMVAFESGFDFIDISDADVYFHGGQSWDLRSIWTAPMNAFELMYLRTTLGTAVLELNGISEDQIELAVKKDMMEYTYDHLAQVPQIDGPKLVYAHINTTHPPFAYSLSAQERKVDVQTNPTVEELGAQTRLYHESIIISNQKVETVIQTILAESRTPPIIILEGDHGPFLSNTREHIFENLNAYYFPDGNYSELYATITPVNSFKVILNQYFGGNYALQPDVSYYSDTRDTWNFEQIPNSCGQ